MHERKRWETWCGRDSARAPLAFRVPDIAALLCPAPSDSLVRRLNGLARKYLDPVVRSTKTLAMMRPGS